MAVAALLMGWPRAPWVANTVLGAKPEIAGAEEAKTKEGKNPEGAQPGASTPKNPGDDKERLAKAKVVLTTAGPDTIVVSLSVTPAPAVP